jgi:hypothetical protein
VNDYLAFGPGSTVMRINEDGGVTLNVYSSAGVTDIRGRLCVPPGYVTDVNVRPIIGFATKTPAGPDCYDLRLTMPSGSPILGNAALAWFNFHTLSNQTTIVPLWMSDVTATKPGGELIPKVVGRDGRVVVVGREALLEAWMTTNRLPMLTLYAPTGSRHALQWTTNLSDSSWLTGPTFEMLELWRTFEVPTNEPSLFFRTEQQ